MNRLLNFFVVVLLLTVVASCKKDDTKPAPGKTDPKTPPAEQKVEVTGVTINPTTLSLEVGVEETLKATVAPENATDKTITWSSSNTEVATVDGSGKVKAVAAGDATITAKSNNGKSASCKVSIIIAEGIPAESVRIDKRGPSIEKGSTIILSAVVSPSNASNQTITWKSENESIATVDNFGRVTGVAQGTVKITATTHNGKSDFAMARVIVTPTAVTFNKETLDMVKNSTATLNAYFVPSDASNKTLTWTSSNPEVATVDKNGKVTSTNLGGITTITAETYNGKKATCKVEVNIPVTEFHLRNGGGNHDNITLELGHTSTLGWYIGPESATNKKVTLTSSDPTLVSCMPPDYQFYPAIQANKNKVGTCTITATTHNGLTITWTVTVPYNAPTSIKLNKETLVINKGSSETLTATLTPYMANPDITWTSSNPNVVSVDDNGKITAKNIVGSATITAKTVNNKEAKCVVSVINN